MKLDQMSFRNIVNIGRWYAKSRRMSFSIGDVKFRFSEEPHQILEYVAYVTKEAG